VVLEKAHKRRNQDYSQCLEKRKLNLSKSHLHKLRSWVPHWLLGSLSERKPPQLRQIRISPAGTLLLTRRALWNKKWPSLSNKKLLRQQHKQVLLGLWRRLESSRRRRQRLKSAVIKSKKFKLAIRRLIWTTWNLCRWGAGQTSAARIFLALACCKRCPHLHQGRWPKQKVYLSTIANFLLQIAAWNNSSQLMMGHGPWVVVPSSTRRFSHNSRRFLRWHLF
jgi:hypothetical protein